MLIYTPRMRLDHLSIDDLYSLLKHLALKPEHGGSNISHPADLDRVAKRIKDLEDDAKHRAVFEQRYLTAGGAR